MDQDAINQAVRAGVEAGVKAALEDKLKPFYIEREEHFKHHEFIREWMDWTNQCKSIILKTVLGTLAVAALALMMIGFAMKRGGN
jgi:hypothetical protein